MEILKPIKKVYNKICSWLSLKKMSWMAIVIFVLSMLPVCYLSFVNRATGDDYGNAVYTRAAWITTHSLIEVGKAAWKSMIHYYNGYQGTWFSLLLFPLQPEVFNEHAYVVVAFFMLFVWIGSTFLLFRQILYKKLQLDIWSYRLITIVFLLISIEFIPSTRASIFWYVGAVHYMFPFAMCQTLTVLLACFRKEYQMKYFTGITLIMTLIGGSNYQAALFALIVAIYMGMIDYFEKRDKHIFWLFFPVLLETAGLIVSMKAPGNKARAGEDFGFSVGRAAETIGMSFFEGFKDAVLYVKEKPLIYIGLFLIFIILLEEYSKRNHEVAKEKSFIFLHPVLGTAALLCLYCAMQAPEIYAGVSVSGGVGNTNFQVFLLCMFGIILIFAFKISNCIKPSVDKLHGRLVIPGILLCFVFIILFRGDIKGSTSYVSLEYIISGQASDYKEQMELQTKLLMNEEASDVIIPGINDVQGPLMHMPITGDVENFTNQSAMKFYGKKSIIAIPRTEWDEKYAEQ